jgi:hypothetical protein
MPGTVVYPDLPEWLLVGATELNGHSFFWTTFPEDVYGLPTRLGEQKTGSPITDKFPQHLREFPGEAQGCP